MGGGKKEGGTECTTGACAIAQEHHRPDGVLIELPETLDQLLSPRRRKITAMRKRDGRIVPFEPGKIGVAVRKASRASGRNYDEQTLADFTERVVGLLEVQQRFRNSGSAIPIKQDIQDAVLATFDSRQAEEISRNISSRTGYDYTRILPVVLSAVVSRKLDPTGDFYRRYMEERASVRDRIVALPFSVEFDSTDRQLQVHSVHNGASHIFDEEKLKAIILERTGVDYDTADRALKRLEGFLAGRTSQEPVTKEEVVAILDAALMEKGVPPSRDLGGRRLTLTLDDINGFIFGKSGENSNIIVNNPEAVNLSIAEMALKELALRDVFDEDVAEAHRTGAIHLHDLGYIDRVYCSAHSVEYIKRYGLDRVVANLNAKSSPARGPTVLNNHIHTFLAAIQSSYAGALGFPMLNTLYGPALLREVEMVMGYETLRNDSGEVVGRVKKRLRRTTLEARVEDGDLREEDFEETGSCRILRGYSKSELKQIAQNLVFGAAQSAFSRGGQTLFIDFNIDLDTPSHVREVPAMFLGGRYKRVKQNERGEWEVIETLREEPERIAGEMIDRGHKNADGSPILEPSHVNGDVRQPTDGTRYVTYGHELVRRSLRMFAEALFEVAADGDKHGDPFNFPKFDVHVGRETFEDPESLELLLKACAVVERNDSIYFMYDRGDGMNVSQCCRLRERITDPAILKHPEKMRFCGFQNVSINLVQAAFRAEGESNWRQAALSPEQRLEHTLREIDRTMVIALKGHTNKRRYIQRLFTTPGSPMHTMGGKPSDDGEPYIDLARSTYIFGIVGLNEAVQHITGKQMHEDAEAFRTGLRIISHMYAVKQQFSQKYGMKFVIEETPGESTNRRFAKIDLIRFGERARAVIKGSLERDQPYYTNSSHLSADAPVSGLDRMILQSRMNPMIEAGAITHIFSGERENRATAVFDFVRAGFYNTQSAQVVFSGEHTVCLECGIHVRGLRDSCACGNKDPSRISQKERVVGYFSDPRVWNRSKQGELLARQATQDYYAGQIPSIRDLASEILTSTIQEGRTRIAVIGSSDCGVCEEAMRRVRRIVGDERYFPKEELGNVEIVKYDVGTEEGRVMAAIYDAPIDTFPTIVVHRGGDFVKGSWEYPYAQKPRGLSTPQIAELMRTFLPEKYKTQVAGSKAGA